jgi:hypothetical protein
MKQLLTSRNLWGASPRSVVVRLIAERISSSGFLGGSLCDIFWQKLVFGRAV